MSGWGRIGSWSGRFSPFGRGSTGSSKPEITDDDFSYISSEDLDHQGHHTVRPSSSSRPARDTDCIVFRHRKVSYPIHFPAYSVDDGDLRIGAARKEVARKLDLHDPRRIRMFYKGRTLKDDDSKCRDLGFRSDTAAEVLCVISDTAQHADDDDDSDGISDSALSAEEVVADGKRKRNRNRKKKGRKSRGGAGGDSDSAASPAPVVEHLPIPSGAHPLHRQHSPANPRTRSPGAPPSPSSSPQTPLGKLSAIADTFHTEYQPQCAAYIDRPPSDPAKRDFDHKRLSETVLAQILLKLDAIETEGVEEVRTKRKELVREVQGWLNKLDEALKRSS